MEPNCSRLNGLGGDLRKKVGLQTVAPSCCGLSIKSRKLLKCRDDYFFFFTAAFLAAFLGAAFFLAAFLGAAFLAAFFATFLATELSSIRNCDVQFPLGFRLPNLKTKPHID